MTFKLLSSSFCCTMLPMRTEGVPVTPPRVAWTLVLVLLPLFTWTVLHSMPIYRFWDAPSSFHNVIKIFSHQMDLVEELFLQLSYPISLDLKGTETKKPCLEECYAKLQAPCSGRFSLSY